jgi:SAM-dependent methyltransferase
MSFKESFYSNYVRRSSGEKVTLENPLRKQIVEYLLGLGEIENLLDIGCSNYALTKIIKNTCSIKNYYACDIVDDAQGILKQMGVVFSQCDLDVNIPFSDVAFDAIMCSEVIEHMFAPDNIFKFAAKTLKEDGCLIITTPNLGVWFNRILLLFGYQPAFSEVSLKYNVGKLYATYEDRVSGHLRMFTLRALVELGRAYGFKTVYKASTGGGPRIIGWLTSIFSIFPSLGNNLICVMRKE